MMPWKPIETAPKDGRYILAVVAGYVPTVVKWEDFKTWPARFHIFAPRWIEDEQGEADDDALFDKLEAEEYSPTHWTDLPESPTP